MSEQSPETTSGSAHEPSMEDILASIRRMIADDDVQAVNTADEPVAQIDPTPEAPQPIDLVEAVAETQEDISLEASAPEPDFSFDTDLTADDLTKANFDTAPDTVFSEFETEFGLEDDLTIPEARLTENLGIADITDTETPSLDGVGADTESLVDIDDLIAEVESKIASDVAGVSPVTLTPEVLTPGASISQDTDIERVKALMAGLTDDAADDNEADSAEHEASVDDAELSQILEDISDIDVNDEFAMEIDIEDAPDDDFNALLQIAQEASEDAKSENSGPRIITTAAEETPTPEPAQTPAEAPTPQPRLKVTTRPATPKQNKKQETPNMPSTAEETIVDSQVEEATTSAFASLASVVDRKDEVVTSGPAIGDLVKDALQPMLKEWLDKNLKGIVERSVAKEIKRIADTK